MTKKQLVKKVLELQDGNEFAKFYLQTNTKRNQFILFIDTNRRMTTEDVLQALDVFIQDAVETGYEIMENPNLISPDDQ